MSTCLHPSKRIRAASALAKSALAAAVTMAALLGGGCMVQDTKPQPKLQAIVAKTVAQVESGDAQRSTQIVLLHDSGGDRSATIAALASRRLRQTS